MKNILIFEDDYDTLFLYRHILKDPQWQLHTYDHCEDIIVEIQKHSPDLIIMDNAIPGEGGIASIKKIKADTAYKNIPVLFSSANLNIEAITTAAGADAYLKKPFDMNELRKMVKSLLH